MSTTQLTRPARPGPAGDGRSRPGALAARFGGLPRPFWIVFAGTIANRIGDMVVPFLVFFLGSRGLSATQTGSVVVALGIGGLVGPPLGGWLSDRFSHRSALIAGLVAVPVALGALFAAPSLPLLMAAAALLGLTGKVYPPAASALVTDAVRAADRPRAMSLMHWAINIGTAVAAASAGYLAARGYWLLFVLDAATCLVFAAIVVAGVPKRHRAATAAATDASSAATAAADAAGAATAGADAAGAGSGSGYGVVLRDRTMMRYTLLLALAVVVYSMTEFAVPLAVRGDGLPPTVFGLIAVVNAGMIVVLQPVVLTPLAALPRVPVLAGSWALVAIGVAATGLAAQPWQYVAAAVVWTAGEIGNGVVAGGIVADLAPADARGRYQGVASWAWAAARLTAFALATGLLAIGGPAGVWWATLAIGLVSAALVLRLSTAIRERTGRA